MVARPVVTRIVTCAGCGQTYDFHRERCERCATLTADSLSWWEQHMDPPRRPSRLARALFLFVLAVLLWAAIYSAVALLN